jgi:hypothetical protein
MMDAGIYETREEVPPTPPIEAPVVTRTSLTTKQ